MRFGNKETAKYIECSNRVSRPAGAASGMGDEMAISNAEKQFRAEFPYTRLEKRLDKFGTIFAVYAGDYPCEESYSRALAFQKSLLYVREGYLTPDPEEQSKVSA